MIQIAESRVTLELSVPKLRVLRKVLGNSSELLLKKAELNARERAEWNEIYLAIHDYIVSQS